MQVVTAVMCAWISKIDYRGELKILNDALEQVGSRECLKAQRSHELTNRIDQEDNTLSDDAQATLARYSCYGRPYLVSYGYEDGVKYIFTMSLLMSAADFNQCDTSYDKCSDYPYIFSVVAFNNVTMEWTVVGRIIKV